MHSWKGWDGDQDITLKMEIVVFRGIWGSQRARNGDFFFLGLLLFPKENCWYFVSVRCVCLEGP